MLQLLLNPNAKKGDRGSMGEIEGKRDKHN